MDLSKFSDSDLMALRDGNLRSLSDEGLQLLASAKDAGKSVYQRQAENQSFGDNLLAGIGGGMVSLYKGGKQALGLADQAEIDAHKEAMSGLTSSKGGFIGNIAGQAAAAAPAMFIPGANTYAGSALLGGALGAAQPTSEGESRLVNTGIGVLGGAAGKFMGDKTAHLLGGNPNASLTAGQKRAMEEGEKLGFKLTPGQRTGSQALQKLEARLESSPWTSRPFDNLKDHNQAVLNRISAKTIGLESDDLSNVMLGDARARIGSVYKDVASDTIKDIDASKIVDDIARIERDYDLMFDLSRDKYFNRYLDLAASGKASGKQLHELSSKLYKEADQKLTSNMGDRYLGKAYQDLKRSVDDTLESTLSGAQKESFKDARSKYRNLMQLTKRNNVLNPASGDVRGNALASYLQSKDKSGFLFGGNNSDLYNAARFAQAFQPIVGNSGTATRSAGNNLQEILAGLTTNQLARIYTSPPTQGLLRITEGGIMPGLQVNPAALGKMGLLGGATTANQLNKR